MIEQLIEIDKQLFLSVNQGLANQFFDFLMPILRNPYTWAPLYLFFIIFAIRNYKKKGIIMILLLLATFGLGDFTSASIIKPEVMRVRPCNDVPFKEQVTTRVRCGSGYSMPSSHATNHFAIGVFILMLFRRKWKPIVWLSLLWAASISFAQIYVGVHYPGDILIGAILGTAIGLFTSWLYFFIQPKLQRSEV
ncbi:phosphatase PAP2 family protein [Albibacterium indicum]|uniref:phosphatase PAP2 family protein n=1 Tax=Albibacterium indicum TaxID=2292082 RepID=UPI000E4E817B|nr:phosphatase PAP2 family protein [Pedobacter indicus]